MQVKEFMTADVHGITLEMTVRDSIVMLTQNKVSGAPVVDSSNHVVSVVSEGDLLKLAAAKLLDKKISACLDHLPKANKLISLSVSSSFIEAYRLFLTNSVHRIIIMDAAGKLQGIVSRSNVLRIIVKSGGEVVSAA